jgi:hypothetical protein
MTLRFASGWSTAGEPFSVMSTIPPRTFAVTGVGQDPHIHIPNRDVMAGEPPASAVINKDGDLIINRLSFDVHTGRFHNRRIVVRDGVRKDKPFSIRLYNAQEIKALFGRVGLEVDKLLGDDGQPLSAQSRRLIVIARKPRHAWRGVLGDAPGGAGSVCTRRFFALATSHP